MAPLNSETFNLTPAQKRLMLSIPTISGALMRFPLGLLSQYIGRRTATLVEMALIAVAMFFGFFFVKTFNDLLAMGALLGIAGASFGVALSLGSGSFPAKHKGLTMGRVGAGTVGAAAGAGVWLGCGVWHSRCRHQYPDGGDGGICKGTGRAGQTRHLQRAHGVPV